VTIYQPTRRHIQEDLNHQLQCEELKYCSSSNIRRALILSSVKTGLKFTTCIQTRVCVRKREDRPSMGCKSWRHKQFRYKLSAK